MTHDLNWLLGEERPVWVIPVGMELAHQALFRGLRDHDHTSLLELDRLDGPHPGHIPGVHNTTLAYREGGRDHAVVVSSVIPRVVESHLKSSRVWLRAVPPAARRIHVDELIVAAVASITGSTINGLMARHDIDDRPDLRTLLGGDAPEVVAVAGSALGEAVRERFEGVDVDPASLVSGLLDQPAADFDDDDDHDARLRSSPRTVATGFHAAGDDHDLLVSYLDLGSIPKDRTKTFASSKKPKTSKGELQVREGRVKLSGPVEVESLRTTKTKTWSTTSTASLKVFAHQKSSLKLWHVYYY